LKKGVFEGLDKFFVWGFAGEDWGELNEEFWRVKIFFFF
jgi:hypothetical protein